MQLKFGVLVSVVAFAASTHAAKFGDRYCKSGLCISAVYDDQAMNVNYTAIFTGSSVGWIGVGQGRQMPGANMMVGWPMPDGSVVLSQRTTAAHVEPTTQQIKAQAFVPHLDASTTNSSMTVLSWSFPVQAGFASSKTSHIWAMSSTLPNSADASASIVRHNHDGTINLDLTKALSTYAPAPASGTGTGSAPASATASTTSSDSSSSSSGSDSQDAEPMLRDLSDRSVRLYLAHMIVMTIAWMGLVPAGILVGRFGRTLFPNSWFKVHRAVQLSAVLLIIVGFALAYNGVDSVGDPHFEGTHQRVGLLMFVLVIVQAFWGQIGHAIFHSRGQRWVNFGHIFLGVVLFFGLSLWQVRTGLQEWTWSPPKSVANIIFPVWFGVITAAWLLGLFLLRRPQKKANVTWEKVPTSNSP